MTDYPMGVARKRTRKKLKNKKTGSKSPKISLLEGAESF